MSASESIKVGPGLNIPSDKNVSERGYHQMYRPIDDARNTINSKVKNARESAAPAKGKFAGGQKTSGAIPYAGGLKPAMEENFGQNDSDIVAKFQGSGFVVKKCNEGNVKDYEQFATTGPGKTRYTGEHNTQQLLRGETKRGQTTPNVNTHYPGLITGEVKRITVPENDLSRTGFDDNIRNYKTTIDRGKSIRSGLPTGAMGNPVISGHDSGPGRFYLNENYTDNGSLPTLNVTGTAGVLGAFGQGYRTDQPANTTNREIHWENKMLSGARGNQGQGSRITDQARTVHRETTNTSTINHGASLVNTGENNTYEESQRNNLRSTTAAGDRPNPGRTNEIAPVKFRVGNYQLNDIRSLADVADRPTANIATNPELKIGQTHTTYNKIVDTYSDPRIGLYLPGGYKDKPGDSRKDCKLSTFDGI